MLITENQLKKIIRNILSEDLGVFPEKYSMPPDELDSAGIDKHTIMGVKRSKESVNFVDAVTDILAVTSIVDPTPISDAAAATVYWLAGKKDEAVMTLLFSAGGFGVGVAAVKAHKTISTARTAKALSVLDEVDPEKANQLRKHMDEMAAAGHEIDHATYRKVAQGRVKNIKLAQKIIWNESDDIVKNAQIAEVAKFIRIDGSPEGIIKAKEIIGDVTNQIANALDDLDQMKDWFDEAIDIANSGGSNLISKAINSTEDGEVFLKAQEIVKSYNGDWKAATKDFFPTGAPKIAIETNRSVFQRIKKFFGWSDDEGAIALIKKDLGENLDITLNIDEPLPDYAYANISKHGSLEVIIDISEPKMIENVSTSTYHEIHHAFEYSAAKQIKNEIHLMTPLLSEFEKMIMMSVKNQSTELKNLDALSIKAGFSAGKAFPPENHVRIIQLKKFLKETGIVKSDDLKSMRRGIYKFFNRYGRHRSFTDLGYKGTPRKPAVAKKLKLYPELDDFHKDWIDVFKNDKTRNEFLELITNYGSLSKPKKWFKDKPSIPGMSKEKYISNIGSETAEQYFTQDDQI